MINLNPSVQEPIATSESSPNVGLDHHCWISFGGNLGDVKGTFDAALALLSLHPSIELGQRAGIYSTTPMGSQAGPPFLNSICGLKTSLLPKELLRVLQAVENQLGRVRDVRWGPRTLDLDLISYGDQSVNEPELTVPHPALTYRRFVLDPLVEIAGDWRHPSYPETAGQLLIRLNPRPLKVELLDIPADEIQELAELLQPQFPDLEFVHNSSDPDGILPIRLKNSSAKRTQTVIDLRHSPGCVAEQLTSALTVIFDKPARISDW